MSTIIPIGKGIKAGMEHLPKFPGRAHFTPTHARQQRRRRTKVSK